MNRGNDERLPLIGTGRRKAVPISLLKALKPFRELDSNMPLQYVTAFLAVAIKEGQNVSEYAKTVGTSQSLMTRHLADIGEINRYHKAGYGLVEAKTDMMDRRNRRNQLTTKGHRLVGQLLGALAK
jgi:DNA-binding MarR family transcriptional regulator